MAGYKISIDQVRRMSHLNIEFEETIRAVMMSQGRRFCPFAEPKCEQEGEAQKTDAQQPNVSISLLNELSDIASEYNDECSGEFTELIFQIVDKWKKVRD